MPQWAIARFLRERAAGLGMVETIRQTQALVHEQLGLLGLSGDLEDVIADFLQSRRAGAGSCGGIELIGRLIVLVDRDLGMQRRGCQTQYECGEAQGSMAHKDSP